MNDNEELVIGNDKIYRVTSLPEHGGEVCKLELIMTKETFIECYKRWIQPQVESEG